MRPFFSCSIVQRDPNEVFFVGGHKDGKSVNIIVKLDTNEMV